MRQVVFEGFQSVDLVGPHAVFHYAREAVGGYDCPVVAPRAGAVRSSGGLTMLATHGIGDLAPEGLDTLVVIGGPGVNDARRDPALVAWTAAAAAGARRVASVCSGALLLAATGFLARIATRWATSPPIEWPRRWAPFQPRASRTATASSVRSSAL